MHIVIWGLKSATIELLIRAYLRLMVTAASIDIEVFKGATFPGLGGSFIFVKGRFKISEGTSG